MAVTWRFAVFVKVSDFSPAGQTTIFERLANFWEPLGNGIRELHLLSSELTSCNGRHLSFRWGDRQNDACEFHPSAVAFPRFLAAHMSLKPIEPPQFGNRSNEGEDFGHPRGTLAIVIVFGSLFLLGWLAMYVYMFLQRGAPHP